MQITNISSNNGKEVVENCLKIWAVLYDFFFFAQIDFKAVEQ